MSGLGQMISHGGLGVRQAALAGVAAIAFVAAAPGAANALIVTTTNATSPLTVAGLPGIDNIVFSPSPAAVAKVVTGSDFTGNFLPQNDAQVGIGTENIFGLPAGTLTFVTGADTPNPSVTVSSATGFNYLAIHQGQGEIVFNFSSYLTSFSYTARKGTTPVALSNYRAYTDGGSNIPGIPEPATVALLGAGLLGLGFARRRRG